MEKIGIFLLVMTISLLIVMPASALTPWDLNADLAANAGWGGGPTTAA